MLHSIFINKKCKTGIDNRRFLKDEEEMENRKIFVSKKVSLSGNAPLYKKDNEGGRPEVNLFISRMRTSRHRKQGES